MHVLLDYDENIRKQVVAVVCYVACHNLTSIPVETTKMVSERLRDKSVYTMEPILSLSLFPAYFSIKDKSKKWVRIFSVFDKVVKALEKILEQKQRFCYNKRCMSTFRSDIRRREGDDTEVQKKVMFCFRVMSCCFGDSAKAQENFQILDQLKDGNVWKISTRLIDPNTSALQASSLR
ncbi:hypothetical protein CASFOL_031580 [Castilleja foliolosa]|uniref:Uncharacterized protein n=1 Tax=Castilleja foliolosa TaxID=1961234 RepID=A0ABD3C5S0_9LAMI